MIGRVLDKYKILEEVGQGGMSVVYKGMDTSLNREVAVKMLPPDYNADRAMLDLLGLRMRPPFDGRRQTVACHGSLG